MTIALPTHNFHKGFTPWRWWDNIEGARLRSAHLPILPAPLHYRVPGQGHSGVVYIRGRLWDRSQHGVRSGMVENNSSKCNRRTLVDHAMGSDDQTRCIQKELGSQLQTLPLVISGKDPSSQFRHATGCLSSSEIICLQQPDSNLDPSSPGQHSSIRFGSLILNNTGCWCCFILYQEPSRKWTSVIPIANTQDSDADGLSQCR